MNLMNKYEFKYINEAGEKKINYIYVENIDAAIEKLSNNYNEILSIKEIKFYYLARFFDKKISYDFICNFSDSLKILLNAGISIQKSLDILERQIENKNYSEKIKEIKYSILNGNTLSNSFSEVQMPSFVCNMIEVGENTGKLEETLELIHNYYYDRNKIKQIIKNATYYPIIILIAMTIAILISVFSVIPNYSVIFESNGENLPYITQLILDSSNFIIKNFYLLTSMFLFSVICIVIFLSTKIGIRLIDFFKLKSKIYIYYLNYNFSISMYMLLGSSVEIIKSIDISKKLLNNEIINLHLETINEFIKSGMSLSYCLSEFKEFSPILISLCEIGEESGMLSDSFYKSSLILKKNIDEFLQGIERKIEITITIILGIILSFIMLGLILPTYTIINTI